MSEKIAFIGAGIATSYTLIPFLDKLKTKSIEHKIEIIVVDKSNDFFKGMPYGSRSGKSVLLIQDLKNFITEPHRTHFKEWLNANLNELVDEFVKNGGMYAKKWVEINSPLYTKGLWDDLYIPRFFFGNYINKEVIKRTNQLVDAGKISLTYVQKETIAISKDNGVYEIHFADNTAIHSSKVILSIGSLPYKKLLSGTISNNDNALYINEPYGLGMEKNMSQIASFIKQRKANNLSTKIAVLGANASGLEMIYKICDKLNINDYNTTFKTLSSHGVMPDAIYDAKKAEKFKPQHLLDLAKANEITADAISNAAHKDIDEAEKQGIGAATTVGIISKGFGALLPKLSNDELLNFACFHGNQIGRRQRCAGQHYLSVVEELSKRDRFDHIKGRFHNLTECVEGIALTSKPSDAPNTDLDSESFNIVINCLGSVNLESKDLTPFFKNLMENNLCRPNPSNIGFTVDKNMQASENLYVAGPLLAGNQIEDRVFWHLEHCARIIWSSAVLADKIIAKIID